MSLQESSKRVDGTGPRNPTSTRCTRPTSQRLSMRLYAYHHLGLAQHVVEDAFTRALVRWGRVVTFDARWRGCARSPGRDPMPPDWGRRGPLHTQGEQYHPKPSPDRVVLSQALPRMPPKQPWTVVLLHLADLPILDTSPSRRVWPKHGQAWLCTAETPWQHNSPI
jgi:RNA polymerase sigma-70 factor (ECF subfamily)